MVTTIQTDGQTYGYTMRPVRIGRQKQADTEKQADSQKFYADRRIGGQTQRIRRHGRPEKQLGDLISLRSFPHKRRLKV
jgi:fructosamine-3-kinase